MKRPGMKYTYRLCVHRRPLYGASTEACDTCMCMPQEHMPRPMLGPGPRAFGFRKPGPGGRQCGVSTHPLCPSHMGEHPTNTGQGDMPHASHNVGPVLPPSHPFFELGNPRPFQCSNLGSPNSVGLEVPSLGGRGYLTQVWWTAPSPPFYAHISFSPFSGAQQGRTFTFRQREMFDVHLALHKR